MPGFWNLRQISIRFEVVGFFFKSEKNLKSSVTQISAILKIISIHEIYANNYKNIQQNDQCKHSQILKKK